MRFLEDIAIGDRAEIGRHTFMAEEIKAFAARFDPQPFHLDEAAARVDGCDFCFTSDGRRSIAAWSRMKRAVDDALPIPHETLHDLRRSAITFWYDAGFDPITVEAIVAHRGSLRGAAGRYVHAKHIKQRRDAMRRWSEHVMALV